MYTLYAFRSITYEYLVFGMTAPAINDAPPVKTARTGRATWAYVAPFTAYMACLAGQQAFPASPRAWLLIRTILVLAVVAAFSRGALRFRAGKPWWSVLVGAGVFAAWIAPDLLWPGYRTHWLFQNGLTGRPESAIPAAMRSDAWLLALRAGSSFLLVPVLEELFWRGWLMRWIVRSNFTSVPLGTYTASAFWVTAVLFASEHGSYWDVGLAAGIAYNWWMLRTRNLADCILAHAVTNALLAAYVLLWGQWQYWL